LGVPIGHLPIYGPPTYEQFMDAYYAEEMERAYGPPKALNPFDPPHPWSPDLWAWFAREVNAERGVTWP
jgi:hypothetical protein